jgi:hypothetical protein
VAKPVPNFTRLNAGRPDVAMKAVFSRAELMTKHGAEYPLPNLLDHLAMPGCSKIKSQWDRCGVYYVNPIESLDR